MRGRYRKRNALAMQVASTLCPNCVQPMRLTRRIGADQIHYGQDVFECFACRVVMTQTARDDQRPTNR